MSIKYMAQWLSGGSICAVEVERETLECVWINGRRTTKNSGWQWYRDTWEEAHAVLLDQADSEVAAARSALQRANDKLGNVKGMKPPKESA